MKTCDRGYCRQLLCDGEIVNSFISFKILRRSQLKINTKKIEDHAKKFVNTGS